MRALLLTAMVLVTGCSAPRINNTRLGSTDLVAMTDKMVTSLLSNPAVASRNPASPRWTVTLDRTSNQTNDVIPQGELWAFMARLRAQISQSPALKERNIVFVLSKGSAAGLNERQADAEPNRAAPDHALTATFYSLTTSGTGARSDAYLCAFQLLDNGGQILWEDRYEIKRAVMRNELD